MQTIDLTDYRARWHKGPQHRSELWGAVDTDHPGYVRWLMGPWSHVPAALGNGHWRILAISQGGAGRDPGHFIQHI
jgi:hypothetical protein